MKPLHNPHFIEFIVYFNENQDFFECHEVLEEYWKSLPNNTKDHPLTGYILLATGMYHWRRGNTIGGLRTLKKANVKFNAALDKYPQFMDGINFEILRKDLNHAIQNIENSRPFTSFPIVVTSNTINSLVREIEPQMELLPFESNAVIHKHMLRDRSSILLKRNEKKKGRY